MNDSELILVIRLGIGYDSSMENHKHVYTQLQRHISEFSTPFAELEDYSLLTHLAGRKENEPQDDTYNDS